MGIRSIWNDLKNSVIFIVIALFSIGLILFLNNIFTLGITEKEMSFFYLTLLLLYTMIVFPSMRKQMKQHFMKTKKWHHIIALPILLAIISLFITYLYRYFPIFINGTPVSIGSNQYVKPEQLSEVVNFVLVGIITPFNEEFIFRFFLLFFAPSVFLYFLVKFDGMRRFLSPIVIKLGDRIYDEIFIKKNKIIMTFWVIVTSSLFSLIHGPDFWSFPSYFAGGVLYSYLFLKYGFLSAFISHGAYNSLSGVMHFVVLKLFSFF